MAKHTPGPWHPCYGGTVKEPSPDTAWCFPIRARNGSLIAIVQCSTDWRESVKLSIPRGVKQEANAHLIAAAPELLDALRAVVKEFVGARTSANVAGDAGVAADMAHAAIAKAEGVAK